MLSLERIAVEVVRAERGHGKVTVIFVGPTRMCQLNKRYRGISRTTDVLSFNAEEKGYFGEILLCRSYVRKQARDIGVPYHEELTRMAIHGVLHLLGYNHERIHGAKKMFSRQEYFLKNFYDISK